LNGCFGIPLNFLQSQNQILGAFCSGAREELSWGIRPNAKGGSGMGAFGKIGRQLTPWFM